MKSFIKNKNLLALYGGNKISRFKFNRYNSIGKEELAAAVKVISLATYPHLLVHGLVQMEEVVFMEEKKF